MISNKYMWSNLSLKIKFNSLIKKSVFKMTRHFDHVLCTCKNITSHNIDYYIKCIFQPLECELGDINRGMIIGARRAG